MARRVILLDVDSTLALATSENKALLSMLASLDENDVVYAYSSCAAFQTYNDISNADHAKNNVTRVRFCNLIQQHSNGKFGGLIGSGCLLHDDVAQHGADFLNHEVGVTQFLNTQYDDAGQKVHVNNVPEIDTTSIDAWLAEHGRPFNSVEDHLAFVEDDIFIGLYISLIIDAASNQASNEALPLDISEFLVQQIDSMCKQLPLGKCSYDFRLIVRIYEQYVRNADEASVSQAFKDWLQSHKDDLSSNRFAKMLDFMLRIKVPDDEKYKGFREKFTRKFQSAKGPMLWHLSRFLEPTDRVFLFDDKDEVILLHQMLAAPCNAHMPQERIWRCFQVAERGFHHSQQVYRAFLGKADDETVCWSSSDVVDHLSVSSTERRLAVPIRLNHNLALADRHHYNYHALSDLIKHQIELHQDNPCQVLLPLSVEYTYFSHDQGKDVSETFDVLVMIDVAKQCFYIAGGPDARLNDINLLSAGGPYAFGGYVSYYARSSSASALTLTEFLMVPIDKLCSKLIYPQVKTTDLQGLIAGNTEPVVIQNKYTITGMKRASQLSHTQMSDGIQLIPMDYQQGRIIPVLFNAKQNSFYVIGHESDQRLQTMLRDQLGIRYGGCLRFNKNTPSGKLSFVETAFYFDLEMQRHQPVLYADDSKQVAIGLAATPTKLSHRVARHLNDRWDQTFGFSSHRAGKRARLKRYLGLPQLSHRTRADSGFDITAYVLGGFVLRPLFNFLKLPLVMLPAGGEALFMSMSHQFQSREVRGWHRVAAKWIGIGLASGLGHVFRGVRLLGQAVTGWSIVPNMPKAWRATRRFFSAMRDRLSSHSDDKYHLISDRAPLDQAFERTVSTDNTLPTCLRMSDSHHLRAGIGVDQQEEEIAVSNHGEASRRGSVSSDTSALAAAGIFNQGSNNPFDTDNNVSDDFGNPFSLK